jgi:hypothetical protein
LFVEVQPKEEDTAAEGTGAAEGEKSAAELIADLAKEAEPKRPGQPAAAPRVGPAAQAPRAATVLPGPSGPVTAATVDFDAVFRSAGVDAADLDRVRKAEELLKALPEATPHDIKRQIVEASLKAFGFDLQKIVAAAQSQTKALDTWTRLNEQQTKKAITDAQAQIAQLEDKVISLSAEITKKSDQLASLGAAAEARKLQVARVLAFFAAPTPAPGAPTT